jgi:TPR repeat protein
MKKLLVAVSLLYASVAWAGDFRDGMTAYDNKNYPVALAKFRLAAAQGNGQAQFNLGVMFEQGQGVAQDYVEAVRWYRLAAAQGLDSAQFMLGTMKLA